MKKVLLSFLLAALFTTTFTSCSDDAEKELSATVGLVGTWTLRSADIMINDQSLEDFVSELAALLNVPEATIAEEFDMGEFSSGTTIEFRDNGTYILNEVGDDTPETGLWSATEKTVTITDADGADPITLQVRSLTSSRASLYMLEEESDGDMNMKIEMTLNFSK